MTSRPPRVALPLRLQGWHLLAVRSAWLVMVVGTTALVTVGFVRAFADPQRIALPSLVAVFTALGLELRLMIALALVAPFATVVVICGFVFWRRSTDPIALLFTLTLLFMYAFSSRVLLTYAHHPVLGHSLSVFFAAGMVCLALIFSLFPDGRWIPRWSRWLPPVAAALVVAFPQGGRLLMSLIDGEARIAGSARALVVAWSAVLLLGLLAQALRYRHVSGTIERQQTKWVVFPFGSLLMLFVVVLLLPLVHPGLPDRWVGMLLFVAVPLGILVPLTVANAVLRYQLFEIDRAISRTVSYAVLTVALAGAYAASVAGLGAVVRAVTGGAGGDLVVAASTLAVAALFQPLRRRIQSLVDRRFNRARYDAQQTVEAFTQRLRSEVDLGTLVDDLDGTVAAALQPRTTSVWLPGTGATRR